MKSILVILRRVYLDITGNHCAAKLVEYFKHWREWKLKNHRTEWIYMPVRQIHQDLMEEHSVGIIRKAINKLIELGILEHRHNPGNGQDRTWQYKLNLGILQSLVNRLQSPEETCNASSHQNEQATVKSDNPMVKSDQCSTQHQSTNIKSTEQVEVENSFPQEEQNQEKDSQSKDLVEQYYEQLKYWQIYPLVWKDDVLIENWRFKPILQALAHIPRPRAERAIQAFLKWIRNKTEKQVRDTYGSIYKALEVALSKGWE
jgi:hypothetical protein